MNLIFSVIIIISSVILFIFHPSAFLSALENGGKTAFDISVKLIVVYAVWLGFFEVLKETGLNRKLAKLFKPVIRFLFGNVGEETESLISLNASCNLLGLGGASTALGLDAMNNLKRTSPEKTQCALFIFNVCALGLFPSTVISLRAEYSSLYPASIILPTVVNTAIAFVFGITLVKLFYIGERCKT